MKRQRLLHLALVFLEESDWLLEDGGCLADGSNQAVVTLGCWRVEGGGILSGHGGQKCQDMGGTEVSPLA